MAKPVLFLASHVRGHVRKIGNRRIPVRPHERQQDRHARAQDSAAQMRLPFDQGKPVPKRAAPIPVADHGPQKPDTSRSGNFYVTTHDPGGNAGKGRHGFLLGPYANHQDALDRVRPARDKAYNVDPKSHWYAFGTARMNADEPGAPGVLNAHLPEHYSDEHAEANRAVFAGRSDDAEAPAAVPSVDDAIAMVGSDMDTAKRASRTYDSRGRIQRMRQLVFGAEDAAEKVVETGDYSHFAPFEANFKKTARMLRAAFGNKS